MLRRIISMILCLSLIVSLSVYSVDAIEYENRYLSVKRVNDDFEKTYEVLTDGENVYLQLCDLVELANFYCEVTDVKDNIINEVVITKKNDPHGFNQDIIIYPKTKTIISDLYGESEFTGCMLYNNIVYLDICKTFNYLRIKANIINKQLFINIPVYTFLDFLIDDYQSALINSVSQLDLLEAGEGKFSSGFFDALSLACNNFDFKLLIPGWGSTELKNEQYKKAIMTLKEEDSVFYYEDSSQYMKEQLEKRGFEGVLASGKDLTNVMSFGGDSIQTVEDIFDALENASKIDSKTYNSYMEVVNWNGELFHGASELKALSKHAKGISDSLSIADIAISAYETYSRANSWNDECIKDLEVLSNLDKDDFNDHKGYIKRIKKMADECYNESKNNSDVVVNQVAEESASLLIEKAITETSIYGKIADLFVLTVNTGVSVARCFGNVAEKMDKNELSYMVTCLINIAVASRIDAEVKYHKLDLKQLNTSKKLDDFRNSLKTYLKSNLRCWSYIYYLNIDGTWENSYRGKEVKSKISKINTYLALINESSQYDYALDEYAINTIVPSSINEILSIDSSTIDNNNDYESDRVSFGDYSIVIPNNLVYEQDGNTVYFCEKENYNKGKELGYMAGTVLFIDKTEESQSTYSGTIKAFGNKNGYYYYANRPLDVEVADVNNQKLMDSLHNAQSQINDMINTFQWETSEVRNGCYGDNTSSNSTVEQMSSNSIVGIWERDGDIVTFTGGEFGTYSFKSHYGMYNETGPYSISTDKTITWISGDGKRTYTYPYVTSKELEEDGSISGWCIEEDRLYLGSYSNYFTRK